MRMRKRSSASPSSQAHGFGWSTRAENVMVVLAVLVAVPLSAMACEPALALLSQKQCRLIQLKAEVDESELDALDQAKGRGLGAGEIKRMQRILRLKLDQQRRVPCPKQTS